MKQKLIRFMRDRYGVDQLGRAMFAVIMICLIISIFVKTNVFYLLALILIIYFYYRTLSKNLEKRYKENRWYLARTEKIRRRLISWKKAWAQRKTHHIYRCPNCKQKIRVPRGKGRIAITCPKCRTEFIKES